MDKLLTGFRHRLGVILGSPILSGVLGLILIGTIIFSLSQNGQLRKLSFKTSNLASELASSSASLSAIQSKYQALANQDQVKNNQNLMLEINNIHQTYVGSLKAYEGIVDLKDQKQDTKKQDQEFARILQYLSDKNYASASASLTDLNNQVDAANQKLAAAQQPAPATTVPVSNTPPGSGYSQQGVQSDEGTFTVDIVSADLNSTKVIVDTASDSDCGNNCPVLPLAGYVSRNGAYAGINGAFFCPATYPSCAGKTNSFDTLLMNKNKVYFNSANNVYSTVPAAIFSAGSARFVSESLQWGRDTSPDAVIANYPLLVQNDSVVYSGSSDPKFNSAGARCFIGNRGNTVYIGCVLSATMENAAHVLKALGLDNALNLDEGGSTALWSGGYKLGPGRDLPDAVLFVKR